MFTYYIRHSHTKKFATKTFEHQGNSPYTSKASEAYAIELLCNDLVQNSQLLALFLGVCIDGDSSASSGFKSHADIRIRALEVFGDPGRNKKGVVKKVEEACGKGTRHAGVSRRVGKLFIGVIKNRTAQAKIDLLDPEAQHVGTLHYARLLQVMCVAALLVF